MSCTQMSDISQFSLFYLIALSIEIISMSSSPLWPWSNGFRAMCSTQQALKQMGIISTWLDARPSPWVHVWTSKTMNSSNHEFQKSQLRLEKTSNEVQPSINTMQLIPQKLLWDLRCKAIDHLLQKSVVFIVFP